jgi:hypothetical protein
VFTDLLVFGFPDEWDEENFKETNYSQMLMVLSWFIVRADEVKRITHKTHRSFEPFVEEDDTGEDEGSSSDSNAAGALPKIGLKGFVEESLRSMVPKDLSDVIIEWFQKPVYSRKKWAEVKKVRVADVFGAAFAFVWLTKFDTSRY